MNRYERLFIFSLTSRDGEGASSDPGTNVTFITNGIRINWTNAVNASRTATIVLWGGSDFDCEVPDRADPAPGTTGSVTSAISDAEAAIVWGMQDLTGGDYNSATSEGHGCSWGVDLFEGQAGANPPHVGFIGSLSVTDPTQFEGGLFTDNCWNICCEKGSASFSNNFGWLTRSGTTFTFNSDSSSSSAQDGGRVFPWSMSFGGLYNKKTGTFKHTSGSGTGATEIQCGFKADMVFVIMTSTPTLDAVQNTPLTGDSLGYALVFNDPDGTSKCVFASFGGKDNRSTTDDG